MPFLFLFSFLHWCFSGSTDWTLQSKQLILKMTVRHFHSDWGGKKKKNMCTITDRHSVHLLSSSQMCTSDLNSNFLKGNIKCLLPCNSLNVYSGYRALSLHCSHSSTIKYPVWRLEAFNNYSTCLEKEFCFTSSIFHFSFHGRGICRQLWLDLPKNVPRNGTKKCNCKLELLVILPALFDEKAAEITPNVKFST